MLMGIRLQAHPTLEQKLVLSQWMGCARFIWNAKCDEHRYFNLFAKKYYPIGVYAPIDASYAQYKNDEISPWLKECPSQLLRNAASRWFYTYNDFMSGLCGKPRRKKKTGSGSIYLTKEVFRFEVCDDGVTRLFIGTKMNNIGYLTIRNHKNHKEPKSIHIKKRNGNYWVSFCYEDDLDISELNTQKDNLKYLCKASKEYLEKHTVGIDRGVVRPVQAGSEVYDLTPNQKRSRNVKEVYLKRYQRRLSEQVKGSNRRHKTKLKLSKCHEKIANIRNDYCHKTSRSIVNNPEVKVIILEDLKTRNMTASPKAKRDEVTGKWLRNGTNAKAGLNRSILKVGWHKLEAYIKYKSYRLGKAWFKVPAYQTSQECAACGHTHPDNRRSQDRFICGSCGHMDNADRNAAEVIKKRAIKLILDSGTELSDRGVLLSGMGRGATGKPLRAKARVASSNEASKKKVKVTMVALTGSSVL
jgi:putative transposase